MNIFFLEKEVERNASSYCDQHVVKIILEICQMAWAAWQATGTEPNNCPVRPYKATKGQLANPMSLWVRACQGNYIYALKLGIHLCLEKAKRFSDKPMHKCFKHLIWLAYNFPPSFGATFKPGQAFAKCSMPPGCSPVPLLMPAHLRQPDLIEAHRTLYRLVKVQFARWAHSHRPRWMPQVQS